MRVFVSAASAFAAIALAAFDVPRTHGAYATAEAASAHACARACADDRLCMAWLYTDNSCALRATIPASPPANVAMGLSPRAPGGFAPAPPVLAAAAPAPTAQTPAPPTPPEEALETAMLLGGPTEADAGLRPAFGAGR